MTEPTLRPYPEYRDADLPWQETAPSHWTRLRLKHLLREIDERTQTAEEPLLSLTRSRGLIRRSELTDKPPSARTLIGYKICRPGDIVMNRMQAWSGMFGLASETGLVSPDYAVLRLTDEADADFLLRLLKSPGPVSHFAALSTGVGSGFNRLYTDQLGAVAVALPPPREQRQIAEAIRDVERRTDRLLRAKRRLIALLEEQKQAIIQRAVTRGLDPDAPMKPSGVDWLGEVPAHWEMRKLKYAASFTGGGTPSKDIAAFWSGDIPWVSPKDMKVEVIHDTQDHITEAAVERSSTKLIDPGAVLIVVRSGILRHSIPVAVNVRAVTLNQDMKAITPSAALIPDYLAAFIRGNQQALLFAWRKQGATVESIEHELMANTYLPIPPVDEQSEITDFLRENLSEVNQVLERANAEINLIREYRTRLIADVVTGKLDVRDTAGASVLPDEVALTEDVVA